MKKCPKCQREIPDYVQQCPFSDCGAEVSGTPSVTSTPSTPKMFTGVIPSAPPIPDGMKIPSAPPVPGGMKIPSAPPVPGGMKIPSAPPVPGGMKKDETEPKTEEKVEELPSVSASSVFSETIQPAPPVPSGMKIPSAPPAPGGMKIPSAPPVPGGMKIPSAPPVPGMVKKEETEPKTELKTEEKLEIIGEEKVEAENVEKLPSISEPKGFSETIQPAPPVPGGIKIPSAPPVPGMVKKEEAEKVLSLDLEEEEQGASEVQEERSIEEDFATEIAEENKEKSEKRVEPAVKGYMPTGKSGEPAVRGYLPTEKEGKSGEPAVRGYLPTGKKGKSGEPEVRGYLPTGKGGEPAVRGYLPTGKGGEPAVRGYLPTGKGGEPAVRGYLPWGRRVEPAVRGMEPPVIMAPGLLGMFVPGMGGYYLNQSAEAILPELSGTETQEELDLREELIGLHVEAQKRLRKGKRLANASFCVMMLTLLVALWGYRELIWCYAEVEPGFTVARDPLETERILLTYTPDSRGLFSVTYNDGVRETTIREALLPEQVGEEQTFGWRLRDLKAEDLLTLTYRDEFMLAQLSKSVESVKFAEDTLATLTDLLLSGEILDATNGKPISGATVRIPGTNFSAESDVEGDFLVSGFPEGKQTFEVTADGFISYKFEMAAQAEPVRVLLSPGLAEGQIRVVLSWEKEPEDLDAHMEGPLPNKEKFHISYGNKGNVDEQFVNLDIDASDGFGPETITVLGVVPGTYRYYVHDYTHQGESGSKNLAQSEAMVKIYYGNQVLGTFLPNADAVGNTWNVCEIQISDDQQASVKALGTFEDKSVQAMGLYEKRTQEDRLAWIEDYGGNADTENAAATALEWLARHQCVTKTKTKRGLNPYGSWSICCLDPESEHCRCEYPELQEGEKPGKLLCMDAAPDYMVANTGLAVLAFQAGGHYYFNDRKFSENVKLGLDWLVENQDKHGALVTPTRAGGYHEKFMYEHGIGTFALAEACAVTRAMGEKVPEKYQKAMEKAVRFTLKIQHNDGGWRYKMDPTEVSDTSVTGWQVLALKSAKEAGYQIPPAVIRKLKVFYENHTRLKNGETRYTNTMAGETEALTGIGLLVRQFLLDEGDSTYVKIGAERLRKAAIGEWESKKEEDRVPDFYTWYKCSLAMQQYGGRDWEVWNEIIRNELVRLMRRDGCQRGSWDPEADVYFDMGGGGRIYVTAMGALTLQVYYRYTTQRERQSQRTLSRVESSRETQKRE